MGGAFVGALLPLAKWRLGAMVVGTVALIPVGVGVRIVRAGLSPWERYEFLALGTFCVILGGGLGLGFREIFRDD